MGMTHLFMTLKTLLMTPNPESALNEAAGKLLLENRDLFNRRAMMMAQVHAGAPKRAEEDDQENQKEATTLQKRSVSTATEGIRKKLRRL